jgi:hypothetical protein
MDPAGPSGRGSLPGAGASPAPAAPKRPRESPPSAPPGAGLGGGWPAYDADLVDNLRATKRFAAAEIAAELSGQLKGLNGGGGEDDAAMACSSAECSPAVTPAVRGADAPAPPGGWATPLRGAVPRGGASMPPRSALGRAAFTPLVLRTGARLPTSPTDRGDAAIEGHEDLRKAALLRTLMRQQAAGGAGDAAAATPRPRSAGAGAEPPLSTGGARSMDCSPAGGFFPAL